MNTGAEARISFACGYIKVADATPKDQRLS